MKQQENITLHNDVQEIPQLAAFIEAFAEKAGLDFSTTMSLNLAMEEAVVNVMNYAYPGETGREIEIQAVKENDMVQFTITDSGVEFDPTTSGEPDLTLAAEDRPIGGLGIHLVRQIMDSISYNRRDGKNILTLTKKTQPEAQ